jgi:hypothetical protein
VNTRQKQFVATELDRLIALHASLRGFVPGCSWAHQPEPLVRLLPVAWQVAANTGLEGRWPRLCLEVLVHAPSPTLRLVLHQPRGPGPDLSAWLTALAEACLRDDSGVVATAGPNAVPPQFTEVLLGCPQPLAVPLGTAGGQELKDYAARLDQAVMRALRSELYQRLLATVTAVVQAPA